MRSWPNAWHVLLLHPLSENAQVTWYKDICGYRRLRSSLQTWSNATDGGFIAFGWTWLSARAADYQRLPDADLNGSDKAVHFLGISIWWLRLIDIQQQSICPLDRMRMFVHAENIRLATGLKPFNFQHEGKWRSHARAIDTKPTGRQSQVIWNFAFLVMDLCLKSRLLTSEFPGIHSWCELGWVDLRHMLNLLKPAMEKMWSKKEPPAFIQWSQTRETIGFGVDCISQDNCICGKCSSLLAWNHQCHGWSIPILKCRRHWHKTN